MSGARASSILANAGFALFGRAGAELFRFVAMLLVAAKLGASDWGRLGLLVGTTELARALTSLGMDTAAMRWMGIHPASADALLGRLLRWKTASGLAVWAALGLAAALGFSPGSLPTGLVAAYACVVVPQGWSRSMLARLQAAHRMKAAVPAQLVAGVLYLAGAWAIGRLGGGLGAFAGLSLAWELLTAALLRRVVRAGERTEASDTVPLPTAARFLMDGLPLGLVDLFVVGYARMALFWLDRTATSAEVGRFYAASRLNDHLVAVGGLLATSALPVLARAWHEGRPDEVRRLLVRQVALGLGASGLAAVFWTLWARPVLALWNADYADAAPALTVLAWAGVAMFQANLLSATLYAMGRFSVTAAFAAANLGVYALSAAFFIPRWGASGAAAATAVTEWLSVLGMSFVVAGHLRSRMRIEPAPDTAATPG